MYSGKILRNGIGGGGRSCLCLNLPFLFWIETLGIWHDWGSIKLGYLFYYCSVILVRTRALFTKFCVAWPIFLTPPPNTIRVKMQPLKCANLNLTGTQQNKFSPSLFLTLTLQSNFPTRISSIPAIDLNIWAFFGDLQCKN